MVYEFIEGKKYRSLKYYRGSRNVGDIFTAQPGTTWRKLRYLDSIKGSSTTSSDFSSWELYREPKLKRV